MYSLSTVVGGRAKRAGQLEWWRYPSPGAQCTTCFLLMSAAVTFCRVMGSKAAGMADVGRVCRHRRVFTVRHV